MDLYTIYKEMDEQDKINYKYITDNFPMQQLYSAISHELQQQILQLSSTNFNTQMAFVVRHEQLKSNLDLMNSFIKMNDTVRMNNI